MLWTLIISPNDSASTAFPITVRVSEFLWAPVYIALCIAPLLEWHSHDSFCWPTPIELPLHVLGIAFYATILYHITYKHLFHGHGNWYETTTGRRNSLWELRTTQWYLWKSKSHKGDDDQSTRSIEENSGKLMWFDSLGGSVMTLRFW